jgi:hypothetical protein
MKLQGYPPVPPEGIREAVREERLAIFVGAGVSRLAGLPQWVDLARALIESCREESLLTYSEEQLILSNTSDSKMLITMAYNIFKNSGREKTFFDAVETKLTPERQDTPNCHNILEWLRSSHALALTTNADKIIDHWFKPTRVVSSVDEMNSKGILPSTLVHIHGIISDPDSLVFTTDQYLKRYNDPEFSNYLKRIFTDKTVLFLGYGLNEFELLVYLLGGKSQQRHFTLAPYFHYQDPIIGVFQDYYNSFNIEQLPYYIDDAGYNILNEIIKEWNDYCRKYTIIPERTLGRIRELVKKDPDEPKIDELKQLINEKVEEDAFLLQLRYSYHAASWIVCLKDEEIFDPARGNSGLQKTVAENGRISYSAPTWLAFDTFADVFEKDPSEESLQAIAQKLLARIKNDTVRHPEKKGNWFTNYLYARVLCMLPDELIMADAIDYLKGALTGLSDDTLILTCIADKKQWVLTWRLESKLYLFKVIIGQYKDKSENRYGLKKFTKTYLDDFTSLFPKEIFDLIHKIFLDLLKKEEYPFPALGAVALYPDSHGYHREDRNDYQYLLFDWLRGAVVHLPDADAEQLFRNMIHSNALLERKIAICIADVHYDSIGSEVFSQMQKQPLFDSTELFPDFYHLIERNAAKIDKDVVKELVEVIEQADFGYKGDRARRYSGHINNMKNCLLFLFNETLTVEKKDTRCIETDTPEIKIADGFSPYDFGKMIVTFDNGWMAPSSKITAIFADRPPDEIVGLLNDISVSTGERRVYHVAFRNYLENLGLNNLQYIEKYAELPIEFYEDLVHALTQLPVGNIPEPNLTKIRNFFLRMLHAAIDHQRVLPSIIDALEKIYLEKKDNEHYEHITRSLLEVADEITDNKERWDEQDPIMLCLNNGYIVLHQSLIHFSAYYKSNSPDCGLANEIYEYFVMKLKNRSNWKIRCAVAFQLMNYRFLLGKDKFNALRLFDTEDVFITAVMAIFFFHPLYKTSFFSDLQHGDLIIRFIENPSVRNYQSGNNLINHAAAYLFLAYLMGDIDFDDDSNAISKLPCLVDGETLQSCMISAIKQFDHVQQPVEIAAKVDIFLSKLLEHQDRHAAISSSGSHMLFEYIKKSGAPSESIWGVIEIIMSNADDMCNDDVMWDTLKQYIDAEVHQGYVVEILETRSESCKYFSRERYPRFFELLDHLENANRDEAQKIRNILIRRGLYSTILCAADTDLNTAQDRTRLL